MQNSRRYRRDRAVRLNREREGGWFNRNRSFNDGVGMYREYRHREVDEKTIPPPADRRQPDRRPNEMSSHSVPSQRRSRSDMPCHPDSQSHQDRRERTLVQRMAVSPIKRVMPNDSYIQHKRKEPVPEAYLSHSQHHLKQKVPKQSSSSSPEFFHAQRLSEDPKDGQDKGHSPKPEMQSFMNAATLLPLKHHNKEKDKEEEERKGDNAPDCQISSYTNSTLNPHENEFVFNPNSNSFIPAPLDQEEEEFQRQFKKCEEDFETWMDHNLDHPGFSQYVQQWQKWRDTEFLKRDQAKADRAAATSQVPASTTTTPEFYENIGLRQTINLMRAEKNYLVLQLRNYEAENRNLYRQVQDLKKLQAEHLENYFPECEGGFIEEVAQVYTEPSEESDVDVGSSSDENADVEALPQDDDLINPLDDMGPPPLPKEKINDIPTVNICQEQVHINLLCVVCMEEFKKDEPVRRLACDHHFHNRCITLWLEQHGTCPICRKLLDSSANEGNDMMDGTSHNSEMSESDSRPLRNTPYNRSTVQDVYDLQEDFD